MSRRPGLPVAGAGRGLPAGRAQRGRPTGPRPGASGAALAAPRAPPEPPSDHTKHALWVKVAAADDPDKASRAITLRVLEFVHKILPRLQQMRVVVRVNRLTTAALRDPKVTGALRARGVERLPALTTAEGCYLGFQEIHDIYDRNIKEYQAFVARGDRPVDISTDDDPLDAMFREEMSFQRAADDTEDEMGLGEGEGLMDDYRRRMEQREGHTSGRPRAGGAPAAPATARGGARGGAPPASAPRARPDNLAPPGEDREYEETIGRLAGDIDDGLRSKAYAAGGGDSLEGDGEDPHDDLMERAYWANQLPSDGQGYA